MKQAPRQIWRPVALALAVGFGAGLLVAPMLFARMPGPAAAMPTVVAEPAATAVAEAPQPSVAATSLPAPAAAPAPTSWPLAVGADFIETFDGEPASPLPFRSGQWDISVHSRDVETWLGLEPMEAQHGADCGPPTTTHTVSSYEQTAFICRNHLMTAINASDYGVLYLTPNQLADFSQGEAIIRFDMSTLRTSQRDWVDIWVSPYDSHLQLPIDFEVDLAGPPREAIQVRMDFVRGAFSATLYQNFQPTEIGGENFYTGYEDFLTPDAARRDTFELRISRDHLAFGMPAYDFWWIDHSIPELSWSQGVVQLGHHSYNPFKDCEGPCGPNTWHWDNISIAPAAPFTMIAADRRFVDSSVNGPVRFAAPAPADAHLRFAAIGDMLELSFDGGRTWQAARQQSHDPQWLNEGHFRSYWTPIPAGTQEVWVRGDGWWGGGWHVRDLSIWAPPE